MGRLFVQPFKHSAWGEDLDPLRGLGHRLQWVPEPHVKFVMDYEQTGFQGDGVGGDREDERFLLSRFQIAF